MKKIRIIESCENCEWFGYNRKNVWCKNPIVVNSSNTKCIAERYNHKCRIIDNDVPIPYWCPLENLKTL